MTQHRQILTKRTRPIPKKMMLAAAFLFSAFATLLAEEGDPAIVNTTVTHVTVGAPKITAIAGNSTHYKIEIEVTYELSSLEKSFVSVTNTAVLIGANGGGDQNLVFSSGLGGPPTPGGGKVKIKYSYNAPIGRETHFTARMLYKDAADTERDKFDKRTFFVTLINP